jgi:hypothetical protein
MQARSKKPRTRSAPKVIRDDAEQSKLFLQKAREIGADEEQSAADELMKELGNTPPDPRKSKK